MKSSLVGEYDVGQGVVKVVTPIHQTHYRRIRFRRN
jgi:hypothetical protein